MAAQRFPGYEVFSGAQTVRMSLPQICSWKSLASTILWQKFHSSSTCCNNPHILFPALNLPLAARPEKILILFALSATDPPQDTGQNTASLQLCFTWYRRGIKPSRLLQEMSRHRWMKSSNMYGCYEEYDGL